MRHKNAIRQPELTLALPLFANGQKQLTFARISYGESWINRGGIGAFMNLARKWDRMFVSRSVITSRAFLSLKTATACHVYMIFLSKCRMERIQTRPGRRSRFQKVNCGKPTSLKMSESK